MLPWSEFQGNVESHLLYVKACLHAGRASTEDATGAIQLHLERRDGGDWSRAAMPWLGLVRMVAAKGAGVADVYERLVQQIADTKAVGGVGPFLQDMLADLVQAGSTKPAQDLIDWFVRVGGPGDSGFAVQLLERGILAQPGGPKVSSFQALPLPAYFAPLVAWILEKGSGELRQPDRAHLLPALVDIVFQGVKDDAAASARHELALRYVVRSPTARTVFTEDRPQGVWPSIEAALKRGSSATLASDFLSSVAEGPGLRECAPESLFLPLTKPKEYPLSRKAILRALASGIFSAGVREAAWPYAFDGGPEGISGLFPSVEDVRRVAAFFIGRAAKANDKGPSWSVGHPKAAPLDKGLRREWSLALANEVLRLSEVTRTNALRGAALEVLSLLAGWAPDGMREAVRAAVEAAADPRFAAVKKVVSEQEPAEAVASALALWPDVPASQVPSTEPAWIAEELTRILNMPCWVDPIGTLDVANLIGLARRVQLEPISKATTDEDQVRTEADRLVVDKDVMTSIAAKESDRERALARCALHLFHELVHLPQGIGRKPDVTRLRMTGSESTLLHIDLGADHAATLLTERALPSWDLLKLKDLLASAVAAYPVTGNHPATARLRKVHRLVSLRLDHVVRSTGKIEIGRNEYVFADFGPGGGQFGVLASGPPFRLLKIVPLSPENAAELMKVADEGRGPGDLAALDDLLRRLIDVR